MGWIVFVQAVAKNAWDLMLKVCYPPMLLSPHADVRKLELSLSGRMAA